MATTKQNEIEDLLRATRRLSSKALGLIMGLSLGLLIFVATNWLILKGGPADAQGNPIVGPNLQLLGQFFLGYRVTFVGSLVGFVWGFAVGSIAGSLIAWIYNKVADVLG